MGGSRAGPLWGTRQPIAGARRAGMSRGTGQRGGRRSLHRPDAPAAEDPLEDRGVALPVEVPVRVEDGARAAREGGEAVELEGALDDDAVRYPPAGRLPDVPECGRPDLTVLELVGGRAAVAALRG